MPLLRKKRCLWHRSCPSFWQNGESPQIAPVQQPPHAPHDPAPVRGTTCCCRWLLPKFITRPQRFNEPLQTTLQQQCAGLRIRSLLQNAKGEAISVQVNTYMTFPVLRFPYHFFYFFIALVSLVELNINVGTECLRGPTPLYEIITRQSYQTGL